MVDPGFKIYCFSVLTSLFFNSIYMNFIFCRFVIQLLSYQNLELTSEGTIIITAIITASTMSSDSDDAPEDIGFKESKQNAIDKNNELNHEIKK